MAIERIPHSLGCKSVRTAFVKCIVANGGLPSFSKPKNNIRCHWFRAGRGGAHREEGYEDTHWHPNWCAVCSPAWCAPIPHTPTELAPIEIHHGCIHSLWTL